MMEKNLGAENINKEEDSASELELDGIDIIKNEIDNGETEIVFVNKNKVEVNFDQEIQKVLNVIQEIQNKEKIITNPKEVKNDMDKLIETLNNLLRDKNNQSEFADKKYICISQKIISATLSQLNNMSKTLIENTNDCYSKDLLDKLENILCCFKKVIKNSTNLSQDQTYTNEIFGIMKNIMARTKKLLLTAIKNFESNQQHENLNSALSNLMEANVKFFSVYKIDNRAFNFLKEFYDEVFGKLIPVLDDNNIDDNLKHDNINLIDIIFDGILRSSDKMTRSCENNPVYTIGDVFIKKYYLRNNTNNKDDWRVPNLDRFIDKYSHSGTYHKYMDYFPIKIELMRKKIEILKNGQVNNLDEKVAIDWTEKYEKSEKFVYGYFDFDPKEFFDLKNNSDEAKKFRLNMGYVIFLQKDLKHIWNLCNNSFRGYKQACKKNSNSEEARGKYKNIKKYRADIYSVFRELETEKQKLLKKRLVNIIRGEFKQLSLCEKIFRLSLLIITFPIYASVFILIKTLRQFFHCFLLGLECIGKLLVFKCKDDCKDVWAKNCEAGNLDGLKINGKEISRRIKWYETKNWLFWRRILFPIDLAIHIIIGIFLATKKIFTSIIKVFVTVCRVGNDIISDDAFSYIFKDNAVMWNKSEIICSLDSEISVLPDTNIKVRNKFVDMTCPRTPCYDFAKEPKSAWEHFLCLIAFKSIKNAEHYDKYAHEHSGTPRLNLLRR